MDEYASMRLTIRWASAMKLPAIMVATASHHTIGFQAATPVNASTSTRNRTANAAAFTAVAM